MKLLVCGPRDFTDRAFVIRTLDEWYEAQPDLGVTVIHGAATGVDSFAGEWAGSMGIREIACPAQWHLHGRAAGPIRNQAMLDQHQPDQVIAFTYRGEPITRGTGNMIQLARQAGVPVELVAGLRVQAPNLPHGSRVRVKDGHPFSGYAGKVVFVKDETAEVRFAVSGRVYPVPVYLLLIQKT